MEAWVAASRKRYRSKLFYVAPCVVLACLVLISYIKHPSSLRKDDIGITPRVLLAEPKPDIPCTESSVFEVDQQCEFVTNSCSEDSFLSYLQLYYCYVDDWVWYVLMFPWFCYLLYSLAHTSDYYFIKTIQQMVHELELSPNVAGVTLLALGNGAADVFSTLAAFTSTDNISEMGTTELAGSGWIMSTMMLFIVVRNSPDGEVKMASVSFIRDTLAYILAISVTMYIHMTGEVHLGSSIILLLMYFAYVTSVYFSERSSTKRRKLSVKSVRVKGLGEQTVDAKAEVRVKGAHEILRTSDIGATPSRAGLAYDFIPSDHQNHELDNRDTIDDEDSYHAALEDDAYDEQVDHFEPSPYNEPIAFGNYGNNNTSAWNFDDHGSLGHYRSHGRHDANDMKMRIDWQDLVVEARNVTDSWLNEQWRNKHWSEKIMVLLMLPLTVTRRLSIPLLGQQYNKWFVAACFLVQPLILTIAFRLEDVELWLDIPVLWYMEMVGALGFIIFTHALWGTDAVPVIKWQRLVLQTWSFASCTVWIYMIGREIVGVLSAFGVVRQIPYAVLGFTLLSWGISIPDGINNTAIARDLSPPMAIAACIAGPMFNLLIGLGISLLTVTTAVYPNPFYVTQALPIEVAFALVLCSLTYMLVTVVFSKFTITSNYVKTLVPFYIVFTVAYMVTFVLDELE